MFGMNHQQTRLDGWYVLNRADVYNCMHQHACIEVFNKLITSSAIERTIIIAVLALFSAHVAITKIHVGLCSALPPRS